MQFVEVFYDFLLIYRRKKFFLKSLQILNEGMSLIFSVFKKSKKYFSFFSDFIKNATQFAFLLL